MRVVGVRLVGTVLSTVDSVALKSLSRSFCRCTLCNRDGKIIQPGIQEATMLQHLTLSLPPPFIPPPSPPLRSLSFSHFPPLDRSEGFYADAGVLGVHGLTGRYLIPPADKLDEAEQAAMIAAVKSELVVPQDPTSTVKINIAWTENDYELDIATEDGQSKSP